MAVLNPEKLAPSESDRGLDESFSRAKETIGPVKFVRLPTASVKELLRRLNNLFVTGGKGILAMGFSSLMEFETTFNPFFKDGKKPNPQFDHNTLFSCLPKIAEVAVLLSCEEDILIDAYEDFDPKKISRLVFHFMNAHTEGEILSLLPVIKKYMDAANKATAVVIPEDTKPGKRGGGKKKMTHRHHHHG